jgi:hypothetical protein
MGNGWLARSLQGRPETVYSERFRHSDIMHAAIFCTLPRSPVFSFSLFIELFALYSLPLSQKLHIQLTEDTWKYPQDSLSNF